MAWDKDKPAGNAPVRVGDDEIRANNDHIEDSLGREHEFPGIYGNTSGRHRFPTGTKANRDSISNPPIGMIFIRTDIHPGGIDVWDGLLWKRRAGPAVGDTQFYIGDPEDLATDRPGWAHCDGSVANGFQTIDLRGKVPVGYAGATAGDVDGDFGYATGTDVYDSGGAKTHQLTIDEMPAHDHDPGTLEESPAHKHTVSVAGEAGVLLAPWVHKSGGVGPTANHDTSTEAHTHAITPEGGDEAHNNLQPYQAMSFIVFVDV